MICISFSALRERGETQASLLSVYFMSGSYVMNRESETDSFKWLSPQALSLIFVVVSLGVGKISFNTSHNFHIFSLSKGFRMIVFNFESF